MALNCMSSENVEIETQQLNPEELVSVLAIVGRIDAQNKLTALDLHNGRHIYHAYSVLDSLSSSYSMFKYFFDLALGGNNDAMHDFMLTPAGIIGISIESLFLVTFSFLGCYFDTDEDQKTEYKRRITVAAIYLREIMKGLKNAYKGLRSAFVAMNLLGLLDLRYLLAPAAIALGIFAAANRSLLCYIRETRKGMMSSAAELLTKIINQESWQSDHRTECKAELDALHQSFTARLVGFAGVFLGGFVDGLYLYVGVLTLASLAPPLFLAMSVICAVYTLSCIIVRTFEEYEFQLKLEHARTKCELAMLSRSLETHYAKLLQVSDPGAAQLSELKELIKQFDETCKRYHQRTGQSLFTAILSGIKNGLYAYGTLASVLFFASTFMYLTGIAFPPALLVATVLSGLVLLVGFTLASVRRHCQHQPKDLANSPQFQKLLSLANATSASLTAQQVKEGLTDGLTLSLCSSFSNATSWFEVLRSLFSGLGKGQKFVDFAGNPLQEQDQDGHYHDAPIMYVLGVLSALVFGITLALRALARSFGRKPLGEVELLDVVRREDGIESTVLQQPETTESVADNESPVIKRTPTPLPAVAPKKNHDKLLCLFGLFSPTSDLPPSDLPSSDLPSASCTGIELGI